ncbi:hypothetical protein G9A89_011208 [Geosiphon pyriformis]|nr:hypothetical protein G9A89_011208 [Geosiphon pyriformis]
MAKPTSIGPNRIGDVFFEKTTPLKAPICTEVFLLYNSDHIRATVKMKHMETNDYDHQRRRVQEGSTPISKCKLVKERQDTLRTVTLEMAFTIVKS